MHPEEIHNKRRDRTEKIINLVLSLGNTMVEQWECLYRQSLSHSSYLPPRCTYWLKPDVTDENLLTAVRQGGFLAL